MSFLQTVLFSKHFNFYFLALYAPIFLTELQNRGIAPSSILQSYFLTRSSKSNYSFRFAIIA